MISFGKWIPLKLIISVIQRLKFVNFSSGWQTLGFLLKPVHIYVEYASHTLEMRMK